MTAALRYLLFRSLVNGLLARFARLRQPKYLLGALFGAAYIYFYFYQFLAGGGEARPPKWIGTEIMPGIAAALLLVAIVLMAWLLPPARLALVFSEAEIAVLFPAPLTRRMLIAYRLMRSQLVLLLLAAVFTLLTGRFREGGDVWFRMGGWWLALSVLSLHRIGASFVLLRWHQGGLPEWLRRGLVLGGMALVGAAAWPQWANLSEMPAGQAVERALSAGVMPVLLLPCRIVMQPFFAQDVASFAVAMMPAGAILLLHFAWVLHADAAFEEAAIHTAQKRAKAMAALQRGEWRLAGKGALARKPLWRLAEAGFAPVAFLWRSLLRFGGRRSLAMWALFFSALSLSTLALSSNVGIKPSREVIIATVIIVLACYLTVLFSVVLVSQHAAAQLRQGMVAMDVLKTYPLPGWQIALGELSGPLLLGSLLQWAALGNGSLLALSFIKQPAVYDAVLGAFVCFAVLLPAFNAVMAIVPSALALMYPGWIKPQEVGAAGVENTGLRLLTGIAQLLIVAVALIPVAFFAACAWFSLAPFMTQHWQLAATATTALAILAVEVAVGIAWLGHLYDTFDLTGE